MVHRCCVSSCGMSVRVLEAKGLSYHKFPIKEPMRDQWVQAIIPHLDKPETFKVVPRYTRVCSRHFRKKDYCMDAKKRARLNSNAVPSVFPRKNTPLVIPTVLPVSPKVSNSKSQSSTDCTAGPSSNVSSSIPSNTNTANRPTVTSAIPNDMKQASDIDAKQLDGLLGTRELVIESATIQDDHLVLTITDSVARGELESVSISNSDDQSQTSASNKVDDSGVVTKRRKRRKWNRTAFARPAKGKRKNLNSKNEPPVEWDGVTDNLQDVNACNGIKLESESNDQLEKTSADSFVNATESSSLNNVTLLLSDLSTQSYQMASVDQELLQSIQAVSLTCGEDVDSSELHTAVGVESFSFNSLVPAFLHHHSSEESLFSNDDSQNVEPLIEAPIVCHQPQELEHENSEVTNEDDALRFELVDLRIDPDMPSVPPPTYLDIDELAHQLNSSLFTDGEIPLFNIESLNLSTENATEQTSSELLLAVNNDIEKKEKPESTAKISLKQNLSRKASSQRTKGKKQDVNKPLNETKLKGVTKRPKKDKILGSFCVERFKHSDKDIEYYTGFNSFRSFEAFFRSLEAYIERICITDVTYGVNNLPNTTDLSATALSNAPTTESGPSGSSSSKATPEQPKKRSCQGRAMSRVNELFMTIIRLRRKLPEKVLGHMFCISQPTVSRVVRAWTVLLSKIIDSYPVKSSISGSSAYKEHSYTSKGMGIPDAFRDLFYSDLAKSIVVTSLNPKKVRTKASSSSSQPHRVKKSKLEKTEKVSKKSTDSVDTKKETGNAASSTLCDFLLDSTDPTDPENPIPIEQLHLFDYI